MPDSPRDTRSRIVQAAMQLFWEKGYGSTSVADILGRAGVNAVAMHGNKSQRQREQALSRFEREPNFVFDYLYRVAVGGEVRQPNLPGTVDEYPNWRLPLPVTLEELRDDPRVRVVVDQLRLRRGRQDGGHV